MNRALILSCLTFAGAVLAPAAGFAGSCSPSATRLCLQDSRFGVEVAWTIPGGASGVGHASPMTSDTGLFWFFSDSNLELVVKVLDGRAINGHFWVYYGGLSDVEYTITVTDSRTGETETYRNPASQLASGADTSAFSAEPLPVGGPLLSGMLAAADASAAAIPLRQGSELQVNVATQGMQWHPDVALGADGGSMVVWAGRPSPLEAGNEMDVYGRFFDAAGNPRGGEIRLNTSVAGIQTLPRVAAAPGGGYMAIWLDGHVVFGRAYGADGQPLTGEIMIGSPLGFQFSLDVAAAGSGFIVAWDDDGPDGFGAVLGILGQRFNAQGGRVGDTFQISGSSLSRTTEEPRLAGLPTGGFVVTWLEGSRPGWSVIAQAFDADTHHIGGDLVAGVKVSSALVEGPYKEAAVPVVHGDGSFSILWTSTRPPLYEGTEALFARRYGPRGQELGGVVELRRGLSPQTPAAVSLPSGDTLVLWYEAGLPLDPDGGVLACLFDSSWNPRGSETRINSFTLLPQTEPAMASDASGRLMAVWSSGLDISQGTPPFPGFVDASQDGSGFGVFGQRFTTATCALSSDQLCLNGRFRVDVQFTNPLSGETGSAHTVPLTSDTGAFWFFGQDNLELILKVLDGRAVNGHFWVYAGALSDVAYTITITDTETGKVKTYSNAPGQLASRADVEAF